MPLRAALSAQEAAVIIRQALEQAGLQGPFHCQPIADGGDGTCALLAESLGLEPHFLMVPDAYGRSVRGVYYLERSAQRAFIDLAAASGLGARGKDRLAPFQASTVGTGLLIADAVAGGCREIVLGLGGTASIDGGMGILQGLGFTYLNRAGRELHAFHPARFQELAFIQRPIGLPALRFTLLADVRHRLFGEEGGIRVFGPQKGLATTDFEHAERGLAAWLELAYAKGKRTFVDQAGYGAAGGVAAGLAAFFSIDLRAGADFFFQQVQLADLIRQSHCVLTGEGHYDTQSAFGKGPHALLCLAEKVNPDAKRILISSGTLGRKAPADRFIALPPLQQQGEMAKKEAAENLFRACYQAFHGA
ncbi:glycerate kinase [Nitritalea halalkaliphila LW7]|uniref:Glycerate kinase n=1 Tax=Nitritalea halalkaliphila LW7 TaxID=1189621 RepID=I5CAN5_9BACT|nr:glycerate kinase [Nitritalea halalkaliphila]EIM78887.1 glycerate kinase [Nitritalea halalkaliphila LW7]